MVHVYVADLVSVALTPHSLACLAPRSLDSWRV